MKSNLKRMIRRLLVLATIAALACLGAWVAWQTHQPRPTVTLSLKGAYTFAGFSDDGQCFIAIETRKTGEGDAHRIVCWDARTGCVIRDELLPDHLRSAELLPSPYQRNWLLLTDRGLPAGTVYVYQLHPWKRLGSVSSLSGMVGTQVLSPCRGWLVQKVETNDRVQTELWNLATGQRTATLPGKFIRFSPSGKLVATSTDQELCLWQFPSGELLRRLPQQVRNFTRSLSRPHFVEGPDILWIDQSDQLVLDMLTDESAPPVKVMTRLEPILQGNGPAAEWLSCGLFMGGREGRYYLGADISEFEQNRERGIPIRFFSRRGTALTRAAVVFVAPAWFHHRLVGDRAFLVTFPESATMPDWIESSLEWLNLKDALLGEHFQTAMVLDLGDGSVLFRRRFPASLLSGWQCIPAQTGEAFALHQNDEQNREVQLWHLPIPTPWLRLAVGVSIPVAFIAVVALAVGGLRRRLRRTGGATLNVQ